MFSPRLPILATLLALIAGCNYGEEGTGWLSIAVTDAPVDDANRVVVEFTGIEIQPATSLIGGFTPAPIRFHFCAGENDEVETSMTECETSRARSIDLLSLQGGVSELLLDDIEVRSGAYAWMRLMVNARAGVIDSYIVLEDGGMHSLLIPGGAQSNLKLMQGFTVPADAAAGFTIDFDLRKSVHKPKGGDYQLRPALRLVDSGEAGAIVGKVPAALMHNESCTSGDAVYVWSGHDTLMLDMRGANDAGPLTTARVALDAETGDYYYHAAFLPAGNYTIAFSCQASDDDPEEADTIGFYAAANVMITAGRFTKHDFSN